MTSPMGPSLQVRATGKVAGRCAHVGLLDTDRVNLVKWRRARFGEANA